MRNRLIAFGAILLVCGVVAATAVVSAADDGGPPVDDPAVASSAAAQLAVATEAAPQGVAPPRTVVYRSLARTDGAAYGRLAFAPLADLAHPTVTGLRCERVHFAAGHGVCLTGGTLPGSWDAVVLGPDLKPLHRVRVGGYPSRTRVSPDGRYGATTVFVTGHSYASAGEFSTQTKIIDLAGGRDLGDLEEWAVDHDGTRVDAPDANFWGVTFAPDDADRFYATLAYGGHTYLIRGSVSARAATVLRENVECPSLSPDGTRLAYKKLVGDGVGAWRFHVLDLATDVETPLAETAPRDDQIEWLDDETVLYGVDEEIWTMPADGSGTPQRWLAQANSPAVVRG